MARPTLLDRTYHFIQTRIVKTGKAPHYTEIAAGLGLSVEQGRKALRDLMASGVRGIWLTPGTDYIASFAPFANFPSQYQITVGRQQKWFGQ